MAPKKNLALNLSDFEVSDFKRVIHRKLNGRYQFSDMDNQYIGLSSNEHFADAAT